MSQNTNLRVAVFDLDGTLCSQDSFKKYLRIRVFKSPHQWILLFPIFWWMLLTYVIRIKNNEWLKIKTIGLVCRGISSHEAKHDADILIRSLSWNQELLTIIEQCRANHIVTILATASPQIYVDFIKYHFGFESAISTQMEQDTSGNWTGNVLGHNCYGEEKKNQISAWCKQNNSHWQNMALFSDSVADLPSFERVGLPIAVQPELQLRRSMARFGIIPLSDAVKKFKQMDNPLL